MAMKPTEEAQYSLIEAARWFSSVGTEKDNRIQLTLMAQGLGLMAGALIRIAIGLRATYMEVEKLKSPSGHW